MEIGAVVHEGVTVEVTISSAVEEGVTVEVKISSEVPVEVVEVGTGVLSLHGVPDSATVEQ